MILVGTLKYYNGLLYEGNFTNSERNGFIKLANLIGEYIGEFKNDLFHGLDLFRISGDKYEGEFKND